jgi:hypothetical protein
MNDLMSRTRPLTSGLKAVVLKNVRLATAAGCAIIGLRVFSPGTAAAGLGCPGNRRRDTTGAGAATIAFANGAHENAGGTAGASLYADSVDWAIDGAGATLDTGILVGNNRLPVFYFEYSLGTDDGAHATAITDHGIESQGNNIFQVLEHFHSS